MNRYRFFIRLTAAFFVCVTGAVFAQEPAYRITDISYDTEGRTRVWALKDILDLEPGLTFATIAELEEFLARQEQILLNQRILQNASVNYTVTPEGGQVDGSPDAAPEDDTPADGADAEPGQINDVFVQVTTRDTWNFIILPYFKYDSNTGLLLSLRTRDYNFFGTNQTLSIDFDYERTDEEEDLFTIAADFRLPFNLFDRRWEAIVEQKLEIEDSDLDFELSTGLGYYFEFLGLDWNAVYTESYRYLTEDPEEDNSFFTSSFDLGSTIDTGLDIPAFGPLNYLPNAYTEWSYRSGGISEERRGLTVGFEHALATGDYDWIGNYRDGQSVSVGNDNAYNIRKEEWKREVTTEAAVYQALWQPSEDVWPKAGLSAGFSGFYLIDGADEEQDDAAKAARGVLNDTMNGDLGLFLNLDAIITFWTLEPIFEAQFGTFFDIAYVRDLRGDFYEKTAFDASRDLRYGAGIEIVGFPLFARSLYVRGSLGFDLVEINEGAAPLSSDAREIFIGLGHHY
ncbi:MAG: hypothetical protein PF508_11550 [Spirochaeta sp.]|nr:hypothetical protein [Spirochaeta sp.]